ncbi:hypothetical protein OF83DRAFT_1060603, partial [Amylostereum chailletii]
KPKDDKTYDAAVKEGSDALAHIAAACHSLPEQEIHRRGTYPVLSTGFSMGTGRTVAGNMKPENDEQEEAMRYLVDHPAFTRIVGHIDTSLKAGAPKLHRHIGALVEEVMDADPLLKKPFANTVYPACTFNLGKKVATFVHKDNLNLPYGWCAVTALGEYDFEMGGHLYLRDLNILLEFPPGCTIFLPSAVVAHCQKRSL